MVKTLLSLVAFALAIGAADLASAQSPPVATESESSSSEPPGRVVVRAGFFDGTMAANQGDWLMDTRELALAVQPWAGRQGWERGLLLGARVGLGGQGDFNGFDRAGVETGYAVQTRALWHDLRFGIAASVIADRWDVWRESPEEGELNGNHWVLGGALRPFVRLWRLELSVPIERGGGFERGTSFRSYGVQLGILIF